MIRCTASKELTCNGLLLDNDGVLIDASNAIEYCWRTLASFYDLPVDEVLAQVSGRRSRDVINGYAQMLPVTVDEALDQYERICIEDTTSVQALPGAVGLLESLPANCWTVVTSGTRDLTRARLESAGLPVPSVLVTAEDVTAGKPDPAPYKLAAERLGFLPKLCLAVEDAPPGLASARAAGCRTIALLTTHKAEQLIGADLYLPNLAHIQAHPGIAGIKLTVTD